MGVSLVPLIVLFSHWFAFGDLDRDLGHAAVALFLAVGFALAGEAVARAEEPPLTGAVRRVVRAGRRRHRLVSACRWAFGRLDDDPARRRPGASGLCDALPLLSGARLAERRGAVVVLSALCDRPDHRRFRGPVARRRCSTACSPATACRRLALAFAAWQLARTTARPAAADHGGGGFVFRADRRSPCWSVTQCMAVSSIRRCRRFRTVDLHADRARRQRDPDRAGRSARRARCSAWFDGDRPGFGGDGAHTAFRAARSAVHRRIDRHNPVLQPAVARPICCRRLPPAASRFCPRQAAAMVFALLACWLPCSPSPTRHCRSAGCSRASSSRCGSDFGQVETYAYSALWLALGVALLAAGLRTRSQVVRTASAALIVSDGGESIPVRHVGARGRPARAILHRARHGADRNRAVLPAAVDPNCRRSAGAGSRYLVHRHKAPPTFVRRRLAPIPQPPSPGREAPSQAKQASSRDLDRGRGTLPSQPCRSGEQIRISKYRQIGKPRQPRASARRPPRPERRHGPFAPWRAWGSSRPCARYPRKGQSKGFSGAKPRIREVFSLRDRFRHIRKSHDKAAVRVMPKVARIDIIHSGFLRSFQASLGGVTLFPIVSL